MIKNAKELTNDFIETLRDGGYQLIEKNIEHEDQPAPHTPHSLPFGKCAVYVFSLKSDWVSPAGTNRVLKVGKVGANSNARFLFQHYNPSSSQSNLANSLLKSRILWKYLGIHYIDETNIGDWIKKNLDRDNFYFTIEKNFTAKLEKYLRARLGPVFEGG